MNTKRASLNLILDRAETEATNLERTLNALPVAELQWRRAGIMAAVTDIYEIAAEDINPDTGALTNRAVFDRAYALILRIDQIGY